MLNLFKKLKNIRHNAVYVIIYKTIVMNQEGVGNYQYTGNFSQEPSNLTQTSVLEPSFNTEMNFGSAPMPTSAQPQSVALPGQMQFGVGVGHEQTQGNGQMQFGVGMQQMQQMQQIQQMQQMQQMQGTEQMQFGSASEQTSETGQIQFGTMPGTMPGTMSGPIQGTGQMQFVAPTQTQSQSQSQSQWDPNSVPVHIQNMVSGMSSSSSTSTDFNLVGETFMDALHTRDERYCLDMLAQIPDPTYLAYVNSEGDTFLTLACKRRMESVFNKLLEYHQFSLVYNKVKTDDDIDGATHTALGFANETGSFSMCEKLLAHPQYCLNNIFDLVYTLEYACEHNQSDIALAILSAPYNISINLDANGPYYSSPHDNTPKVCYPAICEKNIFHRAKNNRMTDVVNKLLTTATDETKYILMEPVQDRIDLACDTLFATLDHAKIQLGMKLSKELTQKLILEKIQTTLQKFGEYSDQIIAEESQQNSKTSNDYDNPYVSARSKKIKRKLETLDDEEDYTNSSGANYNQNNYQQAPYNNYSHDSAMGGNYSNADDEYTGGKKSRFT